MKKVLSILMALLMVFALFACNKPAEPENSTDPGTPAETSTAPGASAETSPAPGTDESSAPELVDVTKTRMSSASFMTASIRSPGKHTKSSTCTRLPCCCTS
jgi:predicted small lipoprotein YifL